MMKYFNEIFESMPRQGPGSEAETGKALRLLTDLPPAPRVLDLGCGTGASTLVLAQMLTGSVTAVDNHAAFLKTLVSHARDSGLAHRVAARLASMTELPFPDGSFDLVWCEAAIYVMGFEEGLRTWKRLLTPGGYLVASEVVWRTGSPPAGALGFWEKEYPAITDVETNVETARNCGYSVVHHFPLATESWWQNYYRPLQQRVEDLRRRRPHSRDAQIVCDVLQWEIGIYERHGDSYGYEFFVLQAPDGEQGPLP